MGEVRPWRPSRDQIALAVLWIILAARHHVWWSIIAAAALGLTVAVDFWLRRPAPPPKDQSHGS